MNKYIYTDIKHILDFVSFFFAFPIIVIISVLIVYCFSYFKDKKQTINNLKNIQQWKIVIIYSSIFVGLPIFILEFIVKQPYSSNITKVAFCILLVLNLIIFIKEILQKYKLDLVEKYYYFFYGIFHNKFRIIKNDNENLLPYESDNKYGYIDNQGNVIIKPIYNNAYNFSEELARALLGYRYRIVYIDKTNKIILSPNIRDGGEFSDGFAKVLVNDKWGYIDKTGQISIEAKYDCVFDFINGLAIVNIRQNIMKYQDLKNGIMNTGKWGVINKLGEEIIKIKYNSINKLSEGMFAIANDNNKYGFINLKDEIIIEPQYLFAFPFSDGLAAVEIKREISDNKNIDSYWIFINKNNENVFNKIFKGASQFKNGFAAFKENQKWGFIDKKGHIVINPQFDSVGEFSEGLADVAINDKYGYINTKGEFIIEPVYSMATSFRNGIAWVTFDGEFIFGRSGYIDKTGNEIWKQKKGATFDFK